MKHQPVKDISLKSKMKINALINEFQKSGGFTTTKLAQGRNILKKMIQNKKCTVFLSFPACIVATGTRGVLTELIKRKWIDAIITTCGTLPRPGRKNLSRGVAGHLISPANPFPGGKNTSGSITRKTSRNWEDGTGKAGFISIPSRMTSESGTTISWQCTAHGIASRTSKTRTRNTS